MSSYEQTVQAWDKRYLYLLFAAEPYEIIAFKIPSTEIDRVPNKLFTHWDPDSKMFTEKGRMPSAGAGLVGLQIGPLIAIMTTAALSIMAFVLVVSAHPAGVGHKGESQDKSLMLPSRARSRYTGEKVDIKLKTSDSPLPNNKSPERENIQVGRGSRAFRMRSVRRFLESEFSFRPGSTPPSCEGKCHGCTPCELQPIVIPHMAVSSVDYKYEHWDCVCKV